MRQPHTLCDVRIIHGIQMPTRRLDPAHALVPAITAKMSTCYKRFPCRAKGAKPSFRSRILETSPPNTNHLKQELGFPDNSKKMARQLRSDWRGKELSGHRLMGFRRAPVMFQVSGSYCC